MSAPPPAVAFDSVTKHYPGGIAVDDVTLAIGPGEFVALVGASGSGKSTLLKTINRLVALDAGRVLIDGDDAADGPAHLMRRRIGYVFQSIGLFPHMTVGENIAVGLRIAGERDNASRVAELLDLVDLPPDVASRMPDALSGGQRQRVGVARALAPSPRLMLMDEAFGALDPVTRDALGKRIRELHERLALTTILVTHDMAEALLLADRVLVMDCGRIVGDASPADIATGRGGEAADALFAVPRAQSRRLAELGAA